MIENRRFINREDGVFLVIFITTLIYFIPSIIYKTLDARSWTYFSLLFFASLFIAYAAIPLIYSRIKISAQLNIFRLNNYCVLTFIACILYFSLIEYIFQASGIPGEQYSIFKYLDLLILHIKNAAGIKPADKFIKEVAIMLIIALPVCEELFFRCYLQESLKRYYNIYFAITIPALLVAARHLALFTILCIPADFSALFITAAAFVSFAFYGYIYEREDNVFSSIIVHFTGNIAFGVCSIIFGGGIKI